MNWSLLRKFGRQFRRFESLAAATLPTERRRVRLGLECLEGRITPTELPPASSLIYLQTNAAGSAISRGDWYTNSANGVGAGYHYIAINVPSGWNTSVPIQVDLFSPEMNANTAGVKDESDNTSSTPSQAANWLDGTVANTQFELYTPGTAVGPAPNVPGPGAAGSLGSQTYAPSTAPEQWVRAFTINPAVTGTGTYILRAQSGDDDQNGWRLRVGADDDADPTNAPPANSDNLDGLPGTNDELTLSIDQTSFQHDVATAGPAQVLVLYEYVAPGQPSVAFHNFDMDGNQAVRYYAPSAAFDPANPLGGGIAATLSSDSSWNTGTSTSRGTGDVINNPEPGWWKIATGTNIHNQFIQEGQIGVAAFYEQPPTPRMTVTKSDGTGFAGPDQLLTYTLSFANVSDADPSPGAALNVVLTDTLPANAAFVSATINGPFTGTVNQVAGVLTATIDGAVNAGASGTVTVTVRVNPNVTSGSVTNAVSLSYADGLGNPYAPVTDSDTDTVTTVTGFVYTDANRNGIFDAGDSPLNGVNVTLTGTDDLGAIAPITVSTNGTGLYQFTSLRPGTYTVSEPTQPAGFADGQETADNITPIPGSIGTDAITGLIVGIGQTDDNNNFGELLSADLQVTKTDGAATYLPGGTVVYTITVANAGPTDATGAQVTDTLSPQVSSATWTASYSGGGTGPASGSGSINVLVDLPSGASVTFTLTAQIAGNATGDLVNTAAAAPPAGVVDPVSANDSATDTDTQAGAPDLVLTKTDGITITAAGAALTYTLTYQNTGNRLATGVVLTETLPAGTIFDVAGSTAGWAETAPGSGIFLLPVGTVAIAGTGTVTFAVTVDNPLPPAPTATSPPRAITPRSPPRPRRTGRSPSRTCRRGSTGPRSPAGCRRVWSPRPIRTAAAMPRRSSAWLMARPGWTSTSASAAPARSPGACSATTR